MSVLAGERVLVIEDEAIVAELIEEMLTELGASASQSGAGIRS
ncbi:MAG TPA: hypothetical protein VJY34_12940 [Roseiarcus sp.]|nr:hypothetical protein [Roseiarcus sp.]